MKRDLRRDRVLRGVAAALSALPDLHLVHQASLEFGPLGRATCDLALIRGAVATAAHIELAVGFGGAAARDLLLAACGAAEVPEVWWVDGDVGWLEIYRAPDGGVYRLRQLVYPGGEIDLPGATGRRGTPLPHDPW